MRTKIALLFAWVFTGFAVFAHIAAMVALVNGGLFLGNDSGRWLLVSVSEGVLAILGYLDAFGHRMGIATGRPNE